MKIFHTIMKLIVMPALILSIVGSIQLVIAEQQMHQRTPPTMQIVKPKDNVGAFKATPGKDDSKENCGKNGCNCWGDEDCKKLIDAGSCNGNPITCDKNNPKACHCD